MTLQYAILGLLEEEHELHGYRIKAMLEERVGISWPVSFGQIYQTLKELRHRGLVDGRFAQGPGHVGRWVYTVTPKGRRAVETWISRSPRSPQPIRDEMLVRLLVLEHRDIAAQLNQIAAQEHVYRQHLTRIASQREAMRDTSPRGGILSALAADAVVFQAEARLRWLAHCADVLRASRRNDDAERTHATPKRPVKSARHGIGGTTHPTRPNRESVETLRYHRA